MRYLSSIARQAQAPCKCPGQAGFLASGCIQKNRQFFSPIYQWPRSSHPISLLNLTAAFRWMECPWGSYFHTPIILAVLSINLLTPPSPTCVLVEVAGADGALKSSFLQTPSMFSFTTQTSTSTQISKTNPPARRPINYHMTQLEAEPAESRQHHPGLLASTGWGPLPAHRRYKHTALHVASTNTGEHAHRETVSDRKCNLIHTPSSKFAGAVLAPVKSCIRNSVQSTYFSLIAAEGEGRKEMLSTTGCNGFLKCISERAPQDLIALKFQVRLQSRPGEKLIHCLVAWATHIHHVITSPK